jgi:hypothetical protein
VNKQKAAPVGQGGGGGVRDPNVILPGRMPGTNELATRFPTRSPTQSPTKSPIVFELPVDELENPGVYQDPFDEMDDPEREEYLENNGPSLPEVTDSESEYLLQGIADMAFGPLFHNREARKIKGDAKGFRNAIVDSYGIGNKRLYGVTVGMEDDLYISELYFGGIYKLNMTSGMVDHLVPSFDFFQRPSAGLAYSRNTLFVAGLGPAFGVDAAIHVYNAESGDQMVSCEPPFSTGQILDITIVGDTAYATDSFLNQLIAMNVDDAIHGICNITSIFLPFNSFLSDDVGNVELGTGQYQPHTNLQVLLLNHSLVVYCGISYGCRYYWI